MSSRRDDPDAFPGRAREPRWRPEPEVGPASGGHLAPDANATGPLFEQSDVPPRSSRPRPRSGADIEPGTRRSSGERSRRRRHPVRRVKRTLRHVDPLSVFKLSLFFYGIGLVLWLIFIAVVYTALASTGIFDTIEVVRDAFAFKGELQIDLWFVERWALLIGVFFWILMSLANLLISFLYNVGADTIGGIEMTFVEKDG